MAVKPLKAFGTPVLDAVGPMPHPAINQLLGAADPKGALNYNYLNIDKPGDPAAEAYGPNYTRLRQLKTKFDPTNFFHMNQNIRPA